MASDTESQEGSVKGTSQYWADCSVKSEPGGNITIFRGSQNGTKGDDFQTVYPEGLILQLCRYCTPFVNAGEESSRWAQTAILATGRGSMELGWFSDSWSFRMDALLLMNAQRKSRPIQVQPGTCFPYLRQKLKMPHQGCRKVQKSQLWFFFAFKGPLWRLFIFYANLPVNAMAYQPTVASSWTRRDIKGTVLIHGIFFA